MSDDHTIRLQSDEQLDTVNEQLRLIRRKNGLTFGTDAYLLAAFVRSQPRERAVDLGSGTGILSLLLCARNKVRSVIAAEVQPVFAELTERNAALNGMADRIRVFAGDVRTLGLRDTDGEVGLVLSNPPYLRAGSGRSNRETEKEIARHEVAGGIADFCAAAGRVLRTGRQILRGLETRTPARTVLRHGGEPTGTEAHDHGARRRGARALRGAGGSGQGRRARPARYTSAVSL